jgi:hypothetical protein
VGLGGGRKGSRFLVADVNPFDPFRPPDRVHKRVEAVTDDAVDARHPGLAEYIDELLTDRAHVDLLCGHSGLGHYSFGGRRLGESYDPRAV